MTGIYLFVIPNLFLFCFAIKNKNSLTIIYLPCSMELFAKSEITPLPYTSTEYCHIHFVGGISVCVVVTISMNVTVRNILDLSGLK